jgi:hypothetical protein
MVLQQKILVQINHNICSMRQLRINNPPDQRGEILDNRDSRDVLD